MVPFRLAAVLGALVLSSSCTTTLAIRSMQPGAVNIGPTRHIVLLHGEGRRSAREFVSQDIDRQVRHRGYFSFDDQSESGIQVRIAGRNVTLDGPAFQLEPTHAGLRIDVLEWNAGRDVRDVQRYDAQGNPFMQQVPVQTGSALLSITLFDSEGHTYLSEAEYEGHIDCDPNLPRDEAMELAASDAVGRFLDDITPHQVVSRVRMDGDDDAQDPMLDLARDGHVAQAAQELRVYLDSDPSNAIAAYNLAVLLEAMGQFEEALSYYDQAIRLGPKDYYHQARAGCAHRLSSAQALAPSV